MPIALDKQHITSRNDRTGKDEKFPALHPKWKQEIQFVTYKPPPLDLEDHAAFEEWMERLGFIENDLEWLLKQEHGQFWCQVIFDETLQQCIDSYLRYAPRSYDLVYSLDPNAKCRHDSVHRLVFMVCVRMATHKESKEHFFTPNIFGEILYENFIFDVPKLMDLCVLYGAGNGPLLSKMISNIFSQQPKYEDDLHASVPTIIQILESIMIKCGIKVGSAPSSPQKLSEARPRGSSLINMSTAEFQDVIFYLSDVSMTMWSFLEMYPAAANMFMEENFLQKLATAYEGIIAALLAAFKERQTESEALGPQLQKMVRQSRIRLLKTFRQIIFHCSLGAVLEALSVEAVADRVESYLEILSSVLHERRFLADYEMLYPSAADFHLLTQSSYLIDETRLLFIQEAITEACIMYGKRQKQHAPVPVGGATLDGMAAAGGAGTATAVGCSESEAALADRYQVDTYQEEAGACARRVTGIELESLISGVKDLFPNLGEGFIEICLEEFNYDTENVVNAVLEDKLPPSLQEMDRSMPREARPLEEEVAPSNVLDQRQNVFDNDEFDVFRRDNVDMSKIHIGKKEKDAGMSVLDDKSSIGDFKSVYDRYGSEFVEQIAEEDGDYNDEYDDTYDSNLIGADDADSADELTTRRPFTVPRILGGREPDSQEGPAESQESEEEEERGPRRDNFVEDPAKIRERQAQRAASRGRGRGQGHRQHDVQGRAKGQGQEADVLRNRAWKEKNKSSRVHHNRRVLADKKRKF